MLIEMRFLFVISYFCSLNVTFTCRSSTTQMTVPPADQDHVSVQSHKQSAPENGNLYVDSSPHDSPEDLMPQKEMWLRLK
jgi:hypothetical protein